MTNPLHSHLPGFLIGEPPAAPVREYQVQVRLPGHESWTDRSGWMREHGNASNWLDEDVRHFTAEAELRIVWRWAMPSEVLVQVRGDKTR
jgi:hypothetical protein